MHAEITRGVLVTFFEVYNELGPGFLESIYQTALTRALASRGIRTDREVPIDVFFRHAVIGRFYADLVVEDRVIIEVKAARNCRECRDQREPVQTSGKGCRSQTG